MSWDRCPPPRNQRMSWGLSDPAKWQFKSDREGWTFREAVLAADTGCLTMGLFAIVGVLSWNSHGDQAELNRITQSVPLHVPEWLSYLWLQESLWHEHIKCTTPSWKGITQRQWLVLDHALWSTKGSLKLVAKDAAFCAKSFNWNLLRAEHCVWGRGRILLWTHKLGL